MNERRLCGLIDTGAHHCCLEADFAKRANIPILLQKVLYRLNFVKANGPVIPTIGSANVCVNIAGYSCQVIGD